jgi:hypothetical protein
VREKIHKPILIALSLPSQSEAFPWFLTALIALLHFWAGGKRHNPQDRGQDKPADEYRLFGGEQRVAIRGYDMDAVEPFISKDNRLQLFNNGNEKPQNANLHYAQRVDDLTFDSKGEIKGVNTPALEGVPSLDRDGTLYVVSDRD